MKSVYMLIVKFVIFNLLLVPEACFCFIYLMNKLCLYCELFYMIQLHFPRLSSVYGVINGPLTIPPSQGHILHIFYKKSVYNKPTLDSINKVKKIARKCAAFVKQFPKKTHLLSI